MGFNALNPPFTRDEDVKFFRWGLDDNSCALFHWETSDSRWWNVTSVFGIQRFWLPTVNKATTYTDSVLCTQLDQVVKRHPYCFYNIQPRTILVFVSVWTIEDSQASSPGREKIVPSVTVRRAEGLKSENILYMLRMPYLKSQLKLFIQPDFIVFGVDEESRRI